MDKPKSIFMYQHLSEISLLNLKNNVLFMAPPSQFSDPFDCELSYHLDEVNDNDIVNIKQILLQENNSNEQQEYFNDLSDADFKIALKNGV